MSRLGPHYLLPLVWLSVFIPTASGASESHWLTVRAHVDVLPEAVVQTIGTEAEGSWFNTVDHPEAAERTMRQHVELICGSIQPGYLKLMPSFADVGLDTPLGQRVYDVEWPACLRVQYLTDITYPVQKGDTLGRIKRYFTGDGVADIDAYFVGSDLTEIDSTKLTINQLINIPFLTTATRLDPKWGGPEELKARLDKIGRKVLSADIEEKIIGQIIGSVDDKPIVGRTTGGLADCEEGDGSLAYPFDAVEVEEAFRHLSGGRRELSLIIIDNGFFGAPAPCLLPSPCPDMSAASAEAERRFPRAIFHDKRGGWGPRLGNYWPLNYSNNTETGQRYGYGDADADSGHGTHVAGLALGGTVLSTSQRRNLFYNDDGPWLRIRSANLSGGRSNIPAGMETAMLTAIKERQDALIANLSVAFNGKELERPVGAIIEAGRSILFVVASGNDKSPVGPMGVLSYPATFGGRVGNVLTVASVDGPVKGIFRLSRFSNHSKSYVDIAAPGCKLESWLDAEGESVRLSGTSQAAPTVTFAATLLRSVWTAGPENIRQRLMISGDLLEPEDRDRVRSGSRLNIAKALTYRWDRITFERDGFRRTLLGALRAQPQGIVCKEGNPPSAEVRAYKRLHTEDELTVVVTTDLELDTCEADVQPGHVVRFDPEFEIDPTGRFIPAVPLDLPVATEELIELIRASGA